MPNEMPLYFGGVASITIFIAPTLVSDSPTARTARPAETQKGFEWTSQSAKKPAEVITEPAMIGLIEPNLDIIKPEVGPKISRTIANGS